MKTFAFKSKVKTNKIEIPEHLFAQMEELEGKDVRVILLAEDTSEFDDSAFKEFTKTFFQKYASNLETIKQMIKNSKK